MAIFGLEVLMTKLPDLAALIRAMGYESDVIAVSDSLPRVQFYIRSPEETDVTVYDTVQVTYIPPDDDSFSHFLINAVTELDAGGYELQRLQTVCDIFNLTTVSGFVCLNADFSRVVYRAVLPEVGEPVSTDVMAFFLKSYIDGLAAFRSLLDSSF